MTDLESPGQLLLLADQIKKDIDNFCVEKWNEGPRSHLGASQIGKPCSRYLWYYFRWCFNKVFNGRMYRLLNRGHFEESRFQMYLEGIGCTVTAFAENSLETENKGDRQIRISACKGHFGGSIDGTITLPEKYGLGQALFLGEYKTKGTGRGFSNLSLNGCQAEAPVHYDQQCIYGYKLGLQYSVYIVVNKNDDSLYIEVIKLDWNRGKELEEKAEAIIFSQVAPEKIALNSKAYECNYCEAKSICFDNEKPLVNCRSCKNAMPVEDARWNCSLYGLIPNKEAILAACPNWRDITKC